VSTYTPKAEARIKQIVDIIIDENKKNVGCDANPRVEASRILGLLMQFEREDFEKGDRKRLKKEQKAMATMVSSLVSMSETMKEILAEVKKQTAIAGGLTESSKVMSDVMRRGEKH
jgi:hypothetical protein